MKKSYFLFSLLFVLFLSPSFAQTTDAPFEEEQPFASKHKKDKDEEDDIPTDVPIDGGLSVLLVAGCLYGASKMNKKKPGQTN